MTNQELRRLQENTYAEVSKMYAHEICKLRKKNRELLVRLNKKEAYIRWLTSEKED